MRSSIEPDPPASATGSPRDWRRNWVAGREERRPSAETDPAFAEEITTAQAHRPELQPDRRGAGGN